MKKPDTLAALAEIAIEQGDIFSAAGVYGFVGGSYLAPLKALMLVKRRDVLRLARWEHTPSAVLQMLADEANSDEMLQTRLMRNQNTPVAGNLENEDLNRSLLMLIAQHSQAPKPLLLKLANEQQNVMLLKALARNPASDVEVLKVLMAREPKKLASELVANPNASAEMLNRLYLQGDGYIKAAVLGHANFDAKDFSQIQKNAGLGRGKPTAMHLLMQRQLAKLAVSPEVLKVLSLSEDSAVRMAVAANKRFENVEALLADKAAAVRRAIAAREDLSISQMQKLSMDEDEWVRVWLARNTSIDRNSMLRLASDANNEVRRAVGRNPRCPLALIKELASDASPWVRAAVAYQLNVDAETLLQLSKDEDLDVLSGVASNSHTPKAVLQKLVKHSEADVRRGVILNKAADRETLLPLLEDAYYLHRLLLVGNKQLTTEDKWGLFDDPDDNVRFSVFAWFGKHLATAVH